jgi:hypothetical protein
LTQVPTYAEGNGKKRKKNAKIPVLAKQRTIFDAEADTLIEVHDAPMPTRANAREMEEGGEEEERTDDECVWLDEAHQAHQFRRC